MWSAVACHRFSSYPNLFTLRLEGPSATVLPSDVKTLLCALPIPDGTTQRSDPPDPRNSLPLNSFADPHQLNPIVSILYKEGVGRGRPMLTAHTCLKSFTCNTYARPRKCCRQWTYDQAKPFGCNTYKKRGGRGTPTFNGEPSKRSNGPSQPFTGQ